MTRQPVPATPNPTFTRRADKSEYVISESRDRSHTADGNYWWPAPDFRWTPGHAATISLTPTGDPAAALPERRQAPPIAYFYQYSATHGGGPTFKFRIHFSEQVDLSWKTLRSNSLTVTNGPVASARRLPGDSKRNWELTVAPTGGHHHSPARRHRLRSAGHGLHA